MMTQELALSLWEYREGALYWRKSVSSKGQVGTRAGYARPDYRNVMYDGNRYPEHKIVFLMHHGYMPKLVTHGNWDKQDNRIENLSEGSAQDNMYDRRISSVGKSGFRGVVKEPKHYKASIYRGGKKLHLGMFKTAEDAAKAYDDAVEKYVKPGYRVYNFPEGRPR